VLAGGSAWVASCASGSAAPRAADALDLLLAAHADVLPERAGAGANHYPMAAEALETLGEERRIEERWRTGAAGYAGPIGRVAPLDGEDVVAALGDYGRYGDWLDRFQRELAREPWQAVVARWTPRLAPGVSAAVFHGLIRTAHAVRALRRRDGAARRGELAVGLAYWAARHAPLAAAPDAPALDTPLAALRPRWIDESEDVPFDDVHARLERVPLVPPITRAEAPARAQLDALVRETAAAFLEMLVLERHRIWLLHTVTGPAAATLLLPELAPDDARLLAACVRRAVMALVLAFGVPYQPGAHLRESTPAWPELVQRAAASGSVHTIKLTEALLRSRALDDRLCRSVAAQWFEWT